MEYGVWHDMAWPRWMYVCCACVPSVPVDGLHCIAYEYLTDRHNNNNKTNNKTNKQQNKTKQLIAYTFTFGFKKGNKTSIYYYCRIGNQQTNASLLEQTKTNKQTRQTTILNIILYIEIRYDTQATRITLHYYSNIFPRRSAFQVCRVIVIVLVIVIVIVVLLLRVVWKQVLLALIDYSISALLYLDVCLLACCGVCVELC
jgi:hypothetical protein